ncbi:putative glutamine amidotransferase [Thermosporothrix hazakensis]|jgi:putative glutamine amidotransferase|uniref:Gamma-glutamyl-gamma-aminobutyrate hydrolase n=2 Tax=Thermosporothrix TaxID=768650 RepID=A0A455SN75_9CHLR|nr:gamma-glutamyl-gamma-aminobutyrate hydrolase family protein [Thermosporothrix hazakensis]PZW22187.1 putative glutamine amidotransferase [Thermosporothrix hazakensis]BBH89893.1 gamma-glutamyl-gamma-aminobutyrate hydrolase [Thermosporothrix sp. COM3]GCE48090.1 gamma-glutamyl-gamma-aminobutyrate hydrolase [Thermosporothrix hazakensis]
MRPLIGIPCHSGVGAESDRPIFFNNKAYIRAVELAGGVPILIPIFEDLSGLETLLPRLDGILFSGGIDVHPSVYQEEPHPMLGETNPLLDKLELALMRYVKEKELPTLGICRGMQLMNVALGGSLYQDLQSQYPGSLKHPNWELPRNHMVHKVIIEPGSRMEKILGVRETRVNSLHHQAVKSKGTGVVISGHAEDGVPELLEVPGHRFMLAAQCHPEEIWRDEPVWGKLFHAFIEECSNAHKRTTLTIDKLFAPIQTHIQAI